MEGDAVDELEGRLSGLGVGGGWVGEWYEGSEGEGRTN